LIQYTYNNENEGHHDADMRGFLHAHLIATKSIEQAGSNGNASDLRSGAFWF